MKTITSTQNSVSILILACFTMPLIIHSMAALKWLLQMNINLFPYDDQLYTFLLALSIFLIPFMRIAKGQINSLNMLAISVFILYMLSLNSNSVTSNSDFDWGKLMVTTMLSAAASWIVYMLARLIKIQTAQKLESNLEQDNNDETENDISETTIAKQDIHNRPIDNIIGYKDNVSELRKHRNDLWGRLEGCRKALEGYLRQDLNDNLKVNYSCPICNEKITQLSQIISHDENCTGRDLEVNRAK